jgi:AmmeMemoRadiSam system protein B/AmmeMemoRadiSam system protein A
MNQASTGPEINTEAKVAPMNTNTTIASLKLDELQSIHQTACNLVTAAVNNKTIDACQQLGQLADLKVSGIFVTLKRGNTLRGCCGMLGASISLAEALADSAEQTALHDPRMAPITAIELPHLTLSVSVLGTPRPIDATGEERINAIQIGQHGLRIRQQKKAGLLLPLVAKERNWNARQFLDAVCSKADLSPETWKREDAVVEIFDGIDHSAAFICVDTDPELPTLSPEHLQKLANWVDSNLVAIQRGGTPFYYAPDVDDMTVAGVTLVASAEKNQEFSLMQLNIKEGIPLQSTFFRLTEAAANHFLSMKESVAKVDSVAVLSQLIHHGTDSAFDAREVDPQRRAILVTDNQHWSLTFDTTKSVDELITSTAADKRFKPGSTMVYSVKCDSTKTRFSLSSSSPAIPHAPERPPAVAGSFYPKRDCERENLVEEILRDLTNKQHSPVHPKQVNAAMVPHAGLRYSGRIAADVWRRIDLPDDILIIGPKHTTDGVNWAVAPHETWTLSDSANMPGNPTFAKMLADHVPGMELDAAAHRREHGIEVQLPFLHRLAPSSRITAIAMGRAAHADLQEAAQALATLLKSLPTPPLIVISSDMNHFAAEQENQRRDKLALEKLAALDPHGLLNTCAKEKISMCGQIPAAFALLTLQHMGCTCKYQEIAYCTSAEVSGDISSVVGYAGILF